ncbi:MAG: serine/threonine-protein kinase [Acidobacteriota bacterium]|nr:serine/threonine-protein kinase [Acidobacteriota bacterium]
MIHGLSERYRIVSTVGTGGMGVVFKAIDTTLNRPVAIKALRPNVLDARAGRGLRLEALAAASLDHPYICKVYELIETPGGQTLIVMEFVEGETLSSKLARGRPPIDAVLMLGSEIAEGLADAHARGVVHRDVKPSNVMVTLHGHVKLVDFGLAVAPSAEALQTTVTGTPQSQIGSPAYMSPEQAKGGEIKAASDLFSLGVLLYECLAGRMPYEGKTGYEYVGNLLAQPAQPLAPLAPGAPRALVALVEACLRKDPAERPESAAAVARELRLLLDKGGRGADAPASDARGYKWAAGLVSAAIIVAALGVALAPHWRKSEGPIDAAREAVPLVTWASEEEDSKVSPDGKWVSFLSDRNGDERLYVQPIEGGDARPVGISGEVLAHVWSPDGRRLACYVSTGSGVFLQIVPAFFGGSVEASLRIGDRIDDTARLVRWVGDDVFLSADSTKGSEGRLLTRIRLSDGRRDNVTPSLEGGGQFQWMDVHPVSSQIVFSAMRDQQEDLWIASLGGGPATRLTNDAPLDRYPLWSGHVVTFQSNRGGQIDLWQIDPDSGRTRLLSSSESEERPESATLDGALVTYQQKNANAKLWRLTPDAAPVPLTSDALSDFAPSASPDGKTLLFQRHAASPSLGMTLFDSQLFSARPNGAGVDAITVSAASGFFPRVSPGGTQVAYFVRPSAASRVVSLHVKDLTTGETKMVSDQCDLPGYSVSPVEWANQNLAWSAGGFLFFIERGDQGALIRRFDPKERVTTTVAGPLKTRVTDLFPSPDGTELAYLLSHDGEIQVRRRSLAAGNEHVARTWRARVGDIYLKGWTPRGELIVVRRGVDGPQSAWPMMTVLALGGPAGQAGQAERQVAGVPRAYALTARLSREGNTLYFDAQERRIHNVYTLALATGAVRRLTANQLQSIAFSGIEPLADGSVIYAMDDRRQDIWLSRITPNRSGQ